jgi:hypothetical protein
MKCEDGQEGSGSKWHGLFQGIILIFNWKGLRKSRILGWMALFLQPGIAYIHKRCHFCGNLLGVCCKKGHILGIQIFIKFISAIKVITTQTLRRKYFGNLNI